MITHSAWDYVYELANGLAEHCDLTVACNHFDWSDEWSRCRRFGIVRLPSATHNSKIGRGARWALRCYRLVRELQPDLLHVQIGNPAVLLALRRTGVPLVVTMHDASIHSGDESIGRLAAQRMALSFADWLVVHGPAAVNELRSLNVEERRLFVHDHGPLTRYGGPDAYRPSRGRTVLFFGRIRRYKGLEFLVRAVESLDQPAELVIAGEGDRAYLDRCLAETRLTPTVYRGFVGRQHAARLFRRATVVCAPYVDASQSGVIAIAKGAGRASVVTASGDLPAAIQEPKFGFVVTPKSASALAHAVGRLLDDTPTRHAMECRAIDYTSSAPWKDISERLYRQYRHWLEERARKE